MHDDFWEYRPTNKEMAVIILVVVIFMVVIYSIGYMCGLRANVHNNGNGADDIREQLGNAVQHQQQITAGIKEAAGTGSAIAESSSAIKESAGAIAGGVADAGILISDCQQIIGGIRNRGKK